MQFFDTSVLVSAFVEDERYHDACSDIVSNSDNGVVSVHALAECFSILTGGRLSIRLLPETATQLIEVNIIQRMKVVTLSAKETMKVLSICQRLGVRGGGIYDCLHLAAARKVEANQLFTLNLRHFTAFAPDLASKIRRP